MKNTFCSIKEKRPEEARFQKPSWFLVIIVEWVDAWMDEWRDGWVDGWMSEWIDGRMDG